MLKNSLTLIRISCIICRSSRETVQVSPGSFFLIFENWSVRKEERVKNKTLKSLKGL